jgi:hypothetical protein
MTLMQTCLIRLFLLVTVAGSVVAQADPVWVDVQHTHPAPGTAIVRFGEIDHRVYKGSKPKNDSDYRCLRSKRIKYILELKFFPFLYRLEKRRAERYGMVVIPATMNASPSRLRKSMCAKSFVYWATKSFGRFTFTAVLVVIGPA